MPQANIPPAVFFLLVIVTPVLLPSKLAGSESVVSYSDQRVLRQFGFNQRAVWIVGDACFTSIREAKSQFMGDGRGKIFADFTSFYWPSLVREGARSPGGASYWMRCIRVFNTFVGKDNKDPLICTMPMPVYARGELMLMRKDYGNPNMPLQQAQRELAREGEADEKEHLAIAQL